MYLALSVSSDRFPRATRVSRYSRTETRKIYYFHLRDHYPLGSCFPAHSFNQKFFNFPHNKLWRSCLTTPLYYPRTQRLLVAYKDRRVVWASAFSLAATYAIFLLRELFSFPLGTEMFYFPRCTLYVIHRVQTHYAMLRGLEFSIFNF